MAMIFHTARPHAPLLAVIARLAMAWVPLEPPEPTWAGVVLPFVVETDGRIRGQVQPGVRIEFEGRPLRIEAQGHLDWRPPPGARMVRLHILQPDGQQLWHRIDIRP